MSIPSIFFSSATATPLFLAGVWQQDFSFNEFARFKTKFLSDSELHNLRISKKNGVVFSIVCPDFRIISITSNSDSTLSKCSHVHLECKIDRESCPLNLAPTTSTTLFLALGDALAAGRCAPFQ